MTITRAKEWDLTEKPKEALPSVGDKIKVVNNFSDHHMAYGEYVITDFFNHFEEDVKSFSEDYPYVVEVTHKENDHAKRNICLIRDTSWFSDHAHLLKISAGRILQTPDGEQILFLNDKDDETFLGKNILSMGEGPDYEIFEKKDFVEFKIYTNVNR
jgi:hypothetical protein